MSRQFVYVLDATICGKNVGKVDKPALGSLSETEINFFASCSALYLKFLIKQVVVRCGSLRTTFLTIPFSANLQKFL